MSRTNHEADARAYLSHQPLQSYDFEDAFVAGWAAAMAQAVTKAAAQAEGQLMPYQVLDLGYGTRTRFAFHALDDKDAWEKSQGYRGKGTLLIREVEGR